MPQYIITPWRFHSELLQVRRELYQLGDSAPPQDDRRHAVNWVAAWKIRGNLPHAIESTAHLVDAVLHHEAGNNSPFSVRATYSAAFCRFVTLFCDTQAKHEERNLERKVEKNEKTTKERRRERLVSSREGGMIGVAARLDMPASFVELRHEATHEELPSLPRLSRNVKMALDWLWQYYWAKLDDDETLDNLAKRRKTDADGEALASSEELRGVLKKFRDERLVEMKAGLVNNVSETSPSGAACLALVKLCQGRMQNLATLAEILLEERMLIPAGRSLDTPMDGAFAIWGNLLRRLTLHQRRFARALLSRMASTIAQPSHLALQLDALREAVYRWLVHIFSSTVWAHPQIKDRVAAQRGAVVNECVMCPNCWTARIARKLVSEGGEEFRQAWMPLVGLIGNE